MYAFYAGCRSLLSLLSAPPATTSVAMGLRIVQLMQKIKPKHAEAERRRSSALVSVSLTRSHPLPLATEVAAFTKWPQSINTHCRHPCGQPQRAIQSADPAAPSEEGSGYQGSSSHSAEVVLAWLCCGVHDSGSRLQCRLAGRWRLSWIIDTDTNTCTK